ncbi:hypothetical protein AB0E66_27355 [Streptomyces sp. NPDC033753]|uniref:hypothetical protein n=1 Tax=Streptomyces sp. NPDC033753 TaxID=3155128 RepID=UPI0033FF0728
MFMRRRPLLRPVVRPRGAPLLRGALVGGAAPASGAAPTVTDQLTRRGELARQGLLTPEEFAAAQAKLLGI